MIYLFGQYFSMRRTIFMLGEAVQIYCAVTLASVALMREPISLFFLFELAWWKILLVTLVTQVSFYFNDLYRAQSIRNRTKLVIRFAFSIGISYIVLNIIYFFWPEAIIRGWVFFVAILFGGLFLVSWRFLYGYTLKKKFLTEKSIIVGDGEFAETLVKEIRNCPDINYDVRLLVRHGNKNCSENRVQDIPISYGFDKLCDLAQAKKVSTIIVAFEQRRGTMPYNELLSCKMGGLSIIDGDSLYERITKKVLVEKINPSWLIFSDGFVKSPAAKLFKRLVGFVLSLILMILLSPLFLIVSIAIKLDSIGPVLFRQQRVGENRKIFTMYKFRSMMGDAEAQCGPVWAEEEDPRITRVGRVIRKFRIDELPQFWNVLKGEMSIVGPRPERPFFVEQLKAKIPYYSIRFSVKPGITGWAQINYPYGSTEKDALEKLKYDLYYIKNERLILDLVVILYTLKIVLLGQGSR